MTELTDPSTISAGRASSRSKAAALSQRVTAIVPTYERAAYLRECLASLLGQTRRPDEIIVIDDGSKDMTLDVVAAFGEQVRYLRQDTNSGKAAALNRALGEAGGDAIWIVDDDDIAGPDALLELARALFSEPAVGWVFGDYDNFEDTADGRVFSRPDWPSVDTGDLYMTLQLDVSIFQPAMLVRRECYQALGGFDTSFVRSQDYDMLLRLSRRFPARHVRRIVFHQRRHLGPRGQENQRIDGAEVWRRQTAFDAAVLRKAYAAGTLADYLPGRLAAPSAGDEIRGTSRTRALMRRAAALARRQLWDLSLQDLAALAASAVSSHDIVARDEIAWLFSRLWPAARWAGDEGGAQAWLDGLRSLPASLARPIRRAVTASILRDFLHEAADRRPIDAARLYRIYRRYESVPGLMSHAGAAARRKIVRACQRWRR